MLVCKRSRFTIPPGITYLNCAYMAPLLKKSEKAGIRGMRKKRNPVSITTDDFFGDTHALRLEFARLISADTSSIAVIPSVSYGIATVAKNIRLRKGQNIIVAAEQFPSNYYSWDRLCREAGGTVRVVSAGESLQNRGKEWNAKILDAIDADTAAVALGHVHWADGTLFNLEAIRQKTREAGAYLIIDGTQSVGALPFDIKRIQPDALICAAYKWLLGPYGTALAYFGDAFLNGIPIEENWINREQSEDFARLVQYKEGYQPGAMRFSMGEQSNFILVPMLLSALRELNRWTPEGIQGYCERITSGAVDKIRESGFWVEDAAYRGAHLFGIRPPEGYDLAALKERLLKKKIYVSFRGNAIRISPNIYNTAEDMEKLARALRP